MSLLLTGCVQQPGISEAEREAIRQEILEELASASESPAPELEGQDGYEVVEVTESVLPGVEINSAGGASLHVNLTSRAPETIKYLRFHAVPFNAVDDPVASEIGRKTKATLSITGPIERGRVGPVGWENVWYNSTIDYVLIETGEVEYMDGTIAQLVFDPPIRVSK